MVSKVPGKYTDVLSPDVAGTFAHKSFGHTSETDYLLSDEEFGVVFRL